jgi:hypothetical protein
MSGSSVPPSASGTVEYLSLSIVATRVHTRLKPEVRGPSAFEERFTTLAPVEGLNVELPFGSGVDERFWLELAETSPPFTGIKGTFARTLRHHGVPLRIPGKLHVNGVQRASLELHLHPFGAVALATVDVLWDPAVPFGDLAGQIEELLKRPATVLLRQPREASVAESARVAVNQLIDLLAEPEGTSVVEKDIRIVTIIRGTIDPVPDAMPVAGDTLFSALYQLAGGMTPNPPPPSGLLVAQWERGVYWWNPTFLLNMLDCGAALFSAHEMQVAPDDKETNLRARHRRLLLLMAHLSASVGLVRVSSTAGNPIKKWGEEAAKRLGRLYGPAMKFMEPSLEPQAYLDRIQASTLVAAITGSPLTSKVQALLPPYPTGSAAPNPTAAQPPTSGSGGGTGSADGPG